MCFKFLTFGANSAITFINPFSSIWPRFMPAISAYVPYTIATICPLLETLSSCRLADYPCRRDHDQCIYPHGDIAKWLKFISVSVTLALEPLNYRERTAAYL